MSQSPVGVVLGFLNAWNQCDLDAVVSHFHEDILYHNIPMTPLRGKAEAEAFVRGIEGLESCRWELVNAAANGNVVLTERVDNFVINGNTVSIPVMGTFEIEGGKIRRWRDYFDLADFQTQMSGIAES